MLDRRLVLGMAFLLCAASVPMAYAGLEYESRIGSQGSGDGELENPVDVLVTADGNKIHVVDRNNDRINVFEKNGNASFRYGSLCNIDADQGCNSRMRGAGNDGDGQFNKPYSIESSQGKFFVVDAYNSRVQELDLSDINNPEFESKFGSTGGNDNLKNATGIAIHDNKRIFVSNTHNDSIVVFKEDKSFDFTFKSFDGAADDFNNPHGLVIDDSRDMLFVANTGDHEIVIFRLVDSDTCPSGTNESVDGVCYVTQFGSSGTDMGEFKDPKGLAYDESNDLLYVTDTENHRIQVFEIVTGDTCPSGTDKIKDGVCFVEEFGSEGTDNGKFKLPMGLALNPSNNLLYVADSGNHRVQVLSVTSGSGSSASNASEAPPKPKNLAAHPVSSTSIMLSWQEPDLADGVPDVTGYKIEHKAGSDSYKTVIENSESTVTSFIHEDLPDESHSYKVYAINSQGESAAASASIRPEHTTTPAGAVATAISPSQVRLTWLPPSDTLGQSVGGYIIYEDFGNNVYGNVLGETGSSTRSFVIMDLSTDKEYAFAVSAKIGAGSTDKSASAKATPREDSTDTSGEPLRSALVPTTVPGKPTAVTASSKSATEIDVTWNIPADDGNSEITGYKIESKKDNGDFSVLVGDTDSISTEYSHTGLSTGSKYTYRISAINAEGAGEPSADAVGHARNPEISISAISQMTTDEGKAVSFNVRLTDSSIRDVEFGLAGNAPSGATMSDSGRFSWTPSDTDGGKTHSFDVTAKKDSMTDRETVRIRVNDVQPAEPAPVEPQEPEQPGLAPFVDAATDPGHYVDRYNSEPSYKEWFDANYPQYSSIYEAVGLEEPMGLASFVDGSRDPQYYVDRYNSEPSYKEWFDENFAQYSSIYEAVGLEEPVQDAAPAVKEGFCGTGTKLVDGVCTVIQKSASKPWWQFW